jgi:hypothetical protein
MNAKSLIHVGIALILFGIAAVVYRADTRGSDERLADAAQPQASMDALKTVGMSWLGGGLLLVGGVILVVVGARLPSSRKEHN